jgi:formamidopyrimidine-DNA glycosylase
MPELPECELARAVLEEVAVGREIDTARVEADRLVLEGVPASRIARALRGRRVEAAERRGKHLWLALDRRPWPLFHLGMTGGFRVPDRPGLELAGSPRVRAETWPPRFTKLLLRLGDGGQIAFTNARRFGRIRLRDDPASEPPVSNLGFDPLLDLPSRERFATLLARRRGTVKGLLLNQGFAAGIGNWIADEVLYQARVDPRRPADSLTRQESDRLRDRIRDVVRRAVAVSADSTRFPRTWLFHRRWGRREGVRTARGETIRHATVAGRTTAYVPERQR